MNKSRKQVQVQKLKEHMILGETIYDEEGKTLYTKGLKLNAKRIQRILNLNLSFIYIETENVAFGVGKTPRTNAKTLEENLIKDKQEAQKIKLIEATKAEAFEIAQNAFSKVLNDGSANSEQIKMIVEKIIEMILRDEQLVLNLSTLNAMDDYLLSHSVNVCILSIMTGIAMNLNQMQLLQLGSGALIHDIGKILVPQDLLKVPRALTLDEFEAIKQHTFYGYKILKDSFKYEDDVAAIALSHHERMDGSGYPQGLSQNQIPLFAKIIAIIDVFDAVTSDRVYCKSINYYDGIQLLIKEGPGFFDEEILKIFIIIIGHYSLGMHVKLSTGETGVVIKTRSSMPVVKIILDSNDQEEKDYYEIDLFKNKSVTIVDIILKVL